MCVVFESNHAANLLLYLTIPRKQDPLRVEPHELKEFLDSFRHRDTFKTWQDDRYKKLSAEVNKALHIFEEVCGHPLDSTLLEKILTPLREFFSNYELFVMPIGYDGARQYNIQIEAFLTHAAASSGEHALVLIPARGVSSFEILDPRPQLSLIHQYPEYLPGMLFWSKTGAAAFTSIEEANGLYEKLRGELLHGTQAVEARLNGYRPPKKSKSILHLSDMHFGSSAARVNKDLLLHRLLEHLPTCTRAVITGDLIDSPKDQNDPAFLEFKDFRRWLAGQIHSEVIIVPGNHDQRWHGNRAGAFGNRKDILGDLHWAQVIPDHALRVVFLCFDSSWGGLAAAGEIQETQMDELMKEYRLKCDLDPRIPGYIKIALLHHHPFPYKEGKEKIIPRQTNQTKKVKFLDGVLKLTFSEDAFLQLEDRHRFSNWLVNQNVPIVLHGHQHIERHHFEELSVETEGGIMKRTVDAIGCGTSLGAEGCPISYNVLTIDPLSQNVTVQFCSDDGKGGPMQQNSMVVLKQD